MRGLRPDRLLQIDDNRVNWRLMQGSAGWLLNIEQEPPSDIVIISTSVIIYRLFFRRVDYVFGFFGPPLFVGLACA